MNRLRLIVEPERFMFEISRKAWMIINNTEMLSNNNYFYIPPEHPEEPYLKFYRRMKLSGRINRE